MILGLEKLTLYRRDFLRDDATGRGEFLEKAETIRASIQQPDHQTMARLGDGFDSEDTRVLVLTKQLKSLNVAKEEYSDQVEFDGGYGLERWAIEEVRDASRWRNKHYHVVVVRVKEDG